MLANKRSLMSGAVLAVSFLMSTAYLSAQEFRASIRGEVVDPSGLALPGAKVTAVETDTQVSYPSTTAADGTFTLLYLLPGKYTVTAEAKGFEKRFYSNVTLEAAQKLDLGNLQMSVGAVNQQVTVTASPGLLQTATASGGSIVDQTKIENLASEGQQVWMDMTFTEGMRILSSAPFNDTVRNDTSDTFTTNGAPSTNNAFYINGAPVSDGGTWYFVPAQDAASEVQSSNNAYDAEYGRASGGSYNSNVKSGTNQFHGEVFEYAENSVLGSSYFQRNLEGLPKTLNNEHNYGGTIGGPIRRDKTFFFFSYGGFRQALPGAIITSVPPVSWLPATGGGVNFTGTGFTVYDPLTTFCATYNSSGGCQTYNRQPFPNDTIPANRISSIGAAILGYYPKPTGSGYTSNFVGTGTAYYHWDQWLGRVDHNLSDRTRIYGVFGLQKNWASSPSNGFSGVANNIGVPSGQPLDGVLDLTHTFSPTLVADLKASFTRYDTTTITGSALAQGLKASSLGSGLTMPVVPSTTHQNIVPTVAVSNFGSLFGNTDSGTVHDDYYLAGSLNQMKGHHNLHYGFEYFDVQSGDLGIQGQPNGAFTFSGIWSRLNPLSGSTSAANSFTDLLLGYPASGSLSDNNSPFIVFHEYGLYIQDDFKLRRNLTLNLGLRWDVDTSITERHNRINGPFCYTCTNPYTSQINYSTYPTLQNPLLGGWTFAGVSAPRSPYNVQLNQWQPRIGIAWSFLPKWVLRAGFGMYGNFGQSGSTTNGFSQTTSYVDTLDGGLNPTNYFASGTPYPSGIILPTGASQGLETSAGGAVSFYPANQRIENTEQYTFGIERELPQHTLLDIQYAGSHTRPMAVSEAMDVISSTQQQACYVSNSVCNTLVPNPFYGVLPSAQTLGSSPTLDAYELTRPWPLFSSITNSSSPIGWTHYNALDVRVDRKVKTLDFVANYTYSNWMDHDTWLNNGTFRDATLFTGPDANDRRQYFNTDILWPLPIGEGQAFARSANGVLGGLINHWMVSSWIIAETGAPLAPPAGYDLTGAPGCTSYLPVGGQTQAHMFNNNSSCYKAQVPYEENTVPTRVGYLRNPGLLSMDLAVRKDFKLRERMALEFICDMTNFLNHPGFTNDAPATNPASPATLQPKVGWTGFGTYTQTEETDPRYFVMALKLKF